MKASELRIELTVDKDWVALNVYRMALERIVRDCEAAPWAYSGEEAADLARTMLEEFPGSAKP
jgi:hypothetical protein